MLNKAKKNNLGLPNDDIADRGGMGSCVSASAQTGACQQHTYVKGFKATLKKLM